MSKFHVGDDRQSLEVPSDDERLADCQACAASGRVRAAAGRTTHPDYRHVDLCVECIALYDNGNPEAVDPLRVAHARE